MSCVTLFCCRIWKLCPRTWSVSVNRLPSLKQMHRPSEGSVGWAVIQCERPVTRLRVRVCTVCDTGYTHNIHLFCTLTRPRYM